jgi:hypothetical protein
MNCKRHARRIEYLVTMYIAGALSGEMDARFFGQWNNLECFPDKVSDNRLIQISYQMMAGGNVYDVRLQRVIRDAAVACGHIGQTLDGYFL